MGIDAAGVGGVGLGIHVDKQGRAPGGAEACGQIDGGGGLADPSLLVGDGDDLGHGVRRAYCRPELMNRNGRPAERRDHVSRETAAGFGPGSAPAPRRTPRARRTSLELDPQGRFVKNSRK